MTQVESDFLKNVVPAAIATEREYGVPASITIAQAIAESGWGKSALAKQANNFFGIKAVANAAPEDYAEFMTDEFVDGRDVKQMARFARYATPTDSFLAHARLLATARRYQPAMAVRRNAGNFAVAIQHCGYSTNPNYAVNLMKLVTEFDLTQYDNHDKGNTP